MMQEMQQEVVELKYPHARCRRPMESTATTDIQHYYLTASEIWRIQQQNGVMKSDSQVASAWNEFHKIQVRLALLVKDLCDYSEYKWLLTASLQEIESRVPLNCLERLAVISTQFCKYTRSVSKNFQLAARQILDIVYSTTIIGRKIDVLSFSPRLATQLGKLEGFELFLDYIRAFFYSQVKGTCYQTHTLAVPANQQNQDRDALDYFEVEFPDNGISISQDVNTEYDQFIKITNYSDASIQFSECWITMVTSHLDSTHIIFNMDYMLKPHEAMWLRYPRNIKSLEMDIDDIDELHFISTFATFPYVPVH